MSDSYSNSSGNSSSFSQNTSNSGSFLLDQEPQLQFLTNFGNEADQYGANQYQWAQDQFNANSGLTNQVVGNDLGVAGAAAGQQQNDLGTYNYYNPGVIGSIVNTANQYSSPDMVAHQMGQAEATTAQAGEQARLNAENNLKSYGIDPSSGRFQALEAQQNAAQGAAEASAGVQAGENTRATGRALTQQAFQDLGTLPGQAATEGNVALQGNTGAQNSALANTQTGALTLGTTPQYLATGVNDVKFAPLGQSSVSQGSSQAQSANSSSSASQPDTNAATGGYIPPSHSPSHGQQVDDIPARLNAGEFVIPRDVVEWFGHQQFQKMIKQARQSRQDPSNAHPTMSQGIPTHYYGGAVQPFSQGGAPDTHGKPVQNFAFGGAPAPTQPGPPIPVTPTGGAGTQGGQVGIGTSTPGQTGYGGHWAFEYHFPIMQHVWVPDGSPSGGGSDTGSTSVPTPDAPPPNPQPTPGQTNQGGGGKKTGSGGGSNFHPPSGTSSSTGPMGSLPNMPAPPAYQPPAYTQPSPYNAQQHAPPAGGQPYSPSTAQYGLPPPNGTNNPNGTTGVDPKAANSPNGGMVYAAPQNNTGVDVYADPTQFMSNAEALMNRPAFNPTANTYQPGIPTQPQAYNLPGTNPNAVPIRNAPVVHTPGTQPPPVGVPTGPAQPPATPTPGQLPPPVTPTLPPPPTFPPPTTPTTTTPTPTTPTTTTPTPTTPTTTTPTPTGPQTVPPGIVNPNPLVTPPGPNPEWPGIYVPPGAPYTYTNQAGPTSIPGYSNPAAGTAL